MFQLQNPSDRSIMLNFDENWEIWLEKFPNIKGIPTKEWGLSEKFLSVYCWGFMDLYVSLMMVKGPPKIKKCEINSCFIKRRIGKI